MALCVSDLVTGDLDLADYEVIGSQHLHDDGGALLVACDGLAGCGAAQCAVDRAADFYLDSAEPAGAAVGTVPDLHTNINISCACKPQY